jgi:cell fate regulator YaaT (PSP1 superfamily)
MFQLHLVRVGAMGQVGRFAPVDGTVFDRGRRVIVRTPRGLELGEVLAAPPLAAEGWSDGPILRLATIEDELLSARLLKNRDEAFLAVTNEIHEQGLSVCLIDVEHLFDGRHLVFYFLGEQPVELEPLLADLAARYDAHAQVRQFAEALTTGCGPDCGSHEAEGHGCGSCATGCGVAGLAAHRGCD